MKNISQTVLPLMAMSLILAACSSHLSKPQTMAGSNGQIALLSGAPAPNTGSVAGSEHQMDELDRSKLYHALDGGIGKATSWDNVATGIEYTVIPTEKLSINGNPFCRRYSITSSKNGSSKEISGTACVSSDGAWHPA